jgi:DNA mismatch repair protein MutH
LRQVGTYRQVVLKLVWFQMSDSRPIYDKGSIRAIYEHAQKLIGVSLAEAVPNRDIQENQKNRGDLGSLVERYYFEHQPPNNHDPDFAEAGVELKTTGVRLAKGGYSAKERLVLTMINYETIIEEEWESSAFLHKCRVMLILFYKYERETPIIRRRFVMDPLLHIIPTNEPSSGNQVADCAVGRIVVVPDEDLAQIRRDWESIQATIKAGRAHELSEGDTYYLGACRKGSGGPAEALRIQPYSDELAKGRAFCLKQSYVNSLISKHKHRASQLGVSVEQDFDRVTREKFAPYLGKSVEQLCKELGIAWHEPVPKNIRRTIVDRILSLSGQKPSELVKAGIEPKTVRIKKNGRVREAMSFPNFSYLEIVTQQWEDSSFFEKLEHKFLFIIFQEDWAGIERLQKVFYWNMPFVDREEARRVWEDTKRRVSIDARNLPTASESLVAHVRPKARNREDTELTPQGEWLVKKCFWLNSGYVESVVAGAR